MVNFKRKQTGACALHNETQLRDLPVIAGFPVLMLEVTMQSLQTAISWYYTNEQIYCSVIFNTISNSVHSKIKQTSSTILIQSTNTKKVIKTTSVWVAKVAKKLQAFLESSEYREFTVKWILSEKQIKDSRVFAFVALPVSIGHSNLIEI